MELRGNRWGKNHSMASVLNDIYNAAKVVSLESKIGALFFNNSTEMIEPFPLKSPVNIYRVGGRVLKGTHKLRYSRCGASKIRVKNNLIAYYIKHNKIIKVFGNIKALDRHLDGVKAFSQLDTLSLKAPEIISTASSPVPFSVEPLVRSKEIQRPLTLLEQEVKDLALFHLFGFTTDYMDFTENEKHVLIQAINRLGFVLKQEEFFSNIKVKNIIIKGPVHGDLSSGNMLEHTDGKILIDWEGFSPNGVTGFEIAKIWLQSNKDTRIRILSVYSASLAKNSKKSYGEFFFERQLVIGLLLHLYKLHSTKRRKYDEARGKTKTEIKAKIKKSEGSIEEGLHSLYHYMNKSTNK